MAADSDSNGERIARIEESLTEIHRQQTAAWRRIDENDKMIADIKISQIQSNAKIESDISHLERDQLKESFSMKTQIAEIGWRVGVVVGAALLVLNFVLSKIDIGHIFDNKPEQKTTRR